LARPLRLGLWHNEDKLLDQTITEMRSTFLIILATLITLCTLGQSRQDQTQILQKCIDLPEIQQYYPVDANKTQLQLFVLQHHPIFYPLDLPVEKFGFPLRFVSPVELSQINPDAFFLFKKFFINPDSASVSMNYSYRNNGTSKMMEIGLAFKKEGPIWSIKEKTIR
jgi:hypothetical protein